MLDQVGNPEDRFSHNEAHIVYRGLHQIRGAFDPLNSQQSTNQLTSKNVLDLARTNLQLAEAIKYRLLPSNVTSSLASKIEPDWHDYLTRAETHAREVYC